MLFRSTIHYPRYYYTPKIGRRWYHEFMWHSVKRTLSRGLDAFRPQAVLGYWTHPDGTVAVRYARQINAKAFVMVGGSDVLLTSPGSTRGRLVCSTLNAADGVLSVSQDLHRRVMECGVPSERVHLVYRGVDRTRFFPGDRSEARARLGLPSGPTLFLWVGRMVPVKGLDILMQAAARLNRRGCFFELVMAGDGVERVRLERMAGTLGLRNVVRFVGNVPHVDLPDWYRAADWCVLSSHSEGVPNVLLEAHACGTPFIATRVGGVAEIAVHGVDRMVPPGDPEGLAEHMAQHVAISAVERDRLASRVLGLETAAATIGALLQGKLQPTQAANRPPVESR